MLAVGVLEITIIFNRDSDIQIFLNGDVLLNGSFGWDFEMELWKDSCCSRKEASSKIGDPGDKTLGRVSKYVC